MANIKINGAVYEDVPSIEVPNADGEMVEYKERMTPYEACIADFRARGWTEYDGDVSKLVYSSLDSLIESKQFIISLSDWRAKYWFETLPNVILDRVPNDIILEQYAFYNCPYVYLSELPDGITTLPRYAFANCQSVNFVKLTNVTKLDVSALQNCSAILRLDMPKLTAIESSALSNCRNIEYLILRSETICQLSASNGVYKCGNNIANFNIYVPSALVDSYKTATNWSVYANQFRALEDYTVDGTITGELDESKI